MQISFQSLKNILKPISEFALFSLFKWHINLRGLCNAKAILIEEH